MVVRHLGHCSTGAGGVFVNDLSSEFNKLGRPGFLSSRLSGCLALLEFFKFDLATLQIMQWHEIGDDLKDGNKVIDEKSNSVRRGCEVLPVDLSCKNFRQVLQIPFGTQGSPNEMSL